MQTRAFHDLVFSSPKMFVFSSANVNDRVVLSVCRQIRFQICVLLFNGYVSLGQSLNPSEPQFPTLQQCDNNAHLKGYCKIN